MDFKQEFINKHPALKDRITRLTNPEELDKEALDAHNNMQKTRGLSNEGRNPSELGSRNVGETLRNTASDIIGNGGQDTQIPAEQVHNENRTVVSGDSNGNTRGKITDTNVRERLAPEQLKISFNPVREAAEKVFKGEIIEI